MDLKKLRVTALAILAIGATLVNSQSASAAQPVSGISSTAYNEGADSAAVFYNPLAVSNVNLTLPQASVNELNNNPGTTVYQHASVTITTADSKVTTFADIGVRLKGQATRTNLYGKAAMKLKFDAFVPGQKFLGLTRMTLNSMVQDPSFVHEDIAYRLYRAMGIIAPRTTYSWVTLNGADFGLYMNIESVDAQMLKRWVTPKHLYSSNCYLADLTYYQSGCYDTNYGDTDRSDLNAAIAVSVYDGADWWREVNKVADMTAVINLMATDIYTSNWDGYTDVVQNNYYLVFDMTGKLRIIPWGQDGAFPMDSSAQLDWLGQGPAFRNFGNQQRSVMLRKCVAYDPCAAQLIRAHVAVKNKAEELALPAFKNKVAAVINNAYVSHETRANPDVGAAIWWQNWLDTFFPYRTASLTAFLATRSPEAPLLSLNGSATLGSTLTAAASTWDYTATLNYQWLRDGIAISNQTTGTYVLTSADAGHLISVKVGAAKQNLPTAFVTSTAVLVSNPVASSASITGTAKVDGTLVGNPISNASTTVTYKWFRAGKAIGGATGPTYTPTILDYLKPITLTTTVNQTGFPLNTTTSQPVIIQAGTIAPPAVAIAGSAVMGGTVLVTATVPTGIKATYQWLRNGAPIASATRTSYTLKADDVNQNLSVRATLTKTGYSPTTVTASAVFVGFGTLTKTPVPTLAGILLVGKTLTGTTGSWDSGTKLSYQWLRNNQPIANATTKTYKLTTLDIGSAIAFRVTATKPGYNSVTNTSLPTAVITK